MLIPIHNPVGIPKVTFVDTTTLYTGANMTTRTLSSVSLGTEASDRIVVIGVVTMGAEGGTVSLAKIGGSGGTAMTILTTAASAQQDTTMAYLLYPTGTTADIYLEFTPYAGAIGMSVHTVTGWNELAPYVSSTDTADVVTLSANVQSGTVGIAVAGGTAINATATCTWTGLTENETLSIYTNGVVSSASSAFTSSESPRTITADWANVTTGAAGVFAAWR